MKRAKTATAAPTIDAPYIHEKLRAFAVPIDGLVLDPVNARKHDRRNLDAIKGSLARWGQRDVIKVQRGTNIVRAGNGRLLVARELGWKYVAAIYLDDDDLNSTAYAIADNRTAELATWDDAVLNPLLAEIVGMDHDLAIDTGFNEEELRNMLAGLGGDGDGGNTDPDAVPDKVPARTKRGDIWLLDPWLECDQCGANVDYDAELVDQECPQCSA